MLGLWLDRQGLSLRRDLPCPEPSPGEARVRVHEAGVCATDLALAGGMYGFRGIPGHEFVGTVEAGPSHLLSRRVVGEINVPCGACAMCARGLEKHCEHRQALGIRDRDGAFAELLILPAANLHPVPDDVPDDVAVFAEPLAAALDVADRVTVGPGDRVLVLGAGRLGQLVCRVLAPVCGELVCVGRSPGKLERLPAGVVPATAGRIEAQSFDLAVECTGHESGLALGLEALRGRGTLVLKSTYRERPTVDTGRIVVEEIRVVGSRCGPFPRALALMAAGELDLEALIDERFPLIEGVRAVARAGEPGVLKVLIEMAERDDETGAGNP